MVRPCITALALAALTHAVAARQITGTLVRPSTGAPIAGQQLVLDRAAGDYTSVPFAMLIFGTPQPAIIARSVTGARGHFRFAITNDRGRLLTVRVAGPPFRSRHSYAVRNLRDSLHPKKPFAEFDSRIMHKPGGGFMPIP